MAPARRPRAVSGRPFCASVMVATAIAAWSFFSPTYREPWSGDELGSVSVLGGGPAAAPGECGYVHRVADQCRFVRENCADEDAGLVPYLQLYYCTLGGAKPVAFAVLLGWMGLLFTTIGIAASDFFSVNLGTISAILGLSESLAGVTFLAFGNGSPDLFSTFAAMGSNSATMAVGELIGAAGFIAAVVAGSMALVREFKVDRKTFVRDICFFMVAVVFTIVFLIDGRLSIWECGLMIGYYLVYVVTVVTWHWCSSRKKNRRRRDSRPLDLASQSSTPYRDDPDAAVERGRGIGGAVGDGGAGGGGGGGGGGPAAAAAGGGGRRVQSGLTDLTGSDSWPRIQIDGEELDDESWRLIAAEVASGMRVLRPRGRRGSITPIRPSLVGALEFRSALAHAARDDLERRGSFLIPPPGRTRSETCAEAVIHPTGRISTAGALEGVPERERAASSAAVDSQSALLPPLLDEICDGLGRESRSPSRSAGSSLAVTGGPGLVPPPVAGYNPPLPLPLQRMRLEIPESQEPGPESPTALSPFPQFVDSPVPVMAHPDSEPAGSPLPPHRPLPAADAGTVSSSGYFPPPPHSVSEAPSGGAGEVTAPYRLWPYRMLPPPDLILRTLFPTLQDWGEKTVWGKFVSAISAPSIFLLVITLPVVDTSRGRDDEGEADEADQRGAEQGNQEGEESTVVNPSLVGTANGLAEASIGMGTNANNTGGGGGSGSEWQRYRRFTRTQSGMSTLPSPAVISIRSRSRSRSRSCTRDSTPMADQPASKPCGNANPDSRDDDNDNDDNDDDKWNRWLVALQIFAGPQFGMGVVWANMADDLQDPSQTLMWMSIYTLAGSVALSALLLVTTIETRRPKYHYLLCFLGFLVSIAWISTIAGEVVGVLKAVGVILSASEAILGLTIFAAGNSLGDLVANMTVARLGYPVMALSACFGGPMLNILLGIGIGGAWMIIQNARHKQIKHPDRPLHYEPYKIHVGGTLVVSAVALLVTLLALLVLVPASRWTLTRRLGWALIALWAVSTVANVVAELTGAWEHLDW